MKSFALAIGVILLAGAALAQPAPTPALLADKIEYIKSRDALVATGNVTFVEGDRRLTAQKVTFLNQTGQLLIEGDVVVTEGDGSQFRADAAELDRDLTSGLIYGARLLLADNFQFAAAEARRIDENTTTLYKAIGSACQVCAEQPVPLWLIRADKVIRDDKAKQLHFQNAKFDIFGVTIGYLPYFRMADPSVDRATGFLNPRFRRSDLFGFGLSIPYYIAISDDSDATITPFVTTSGASIIGGEYRKRFATGWVDAAGSLALEDGNGASFERGHISIDGGFSLNNDYALEFSLNNATDKSYLGEFGFSDTDRLQSGVTVSRQKQNEYTQISAIGFQSLREDENDSEIPFVLPEAMYDTYWDLDRIGGRLELQTSLVGLLRRDGRDVARAGASLNWRRNFSLDNGLIGNGFVGASGRIYAVGDDSSFDSNLTGIVVPLLGAELRWPLARRDADATHVIEPIAQIVYSEVHGDYGNIPNEDSLEIEFDAANLFALNRYPGSDRIEEGGRLNLGARYTRIDEDGWQISTTIGQVFRSERQSEFPDNTGLNQLSSNIVASAILEFPPGFSLSNQTLFDRGLSFARNDIQASLDWGDFEMDSSYVFLLADPTAGAMEDRHEFAFSSRYAFSPNWAFDTQWRRDLNNGTNVYAEAGLEFQNECLKTRFSASRRFTNSGTLPASTEFGLSVNLAGFGGSGEGTARKCVTY